MTKPDDPAFPRPLSKLSTEEVSADQEGMSIRAYMATRLLAGLLAREPDSSDMRDRARIAVMYADELMLILNDDQPNDALKSRRDLDRDNAHLRRENGNLRQEVETLRAMLRKGDAK